MKSVSRRISFFVAFFGLLLLPCSVVLGLPADKLVDGGVGTTQNEIDLTLIPGQSGRLAMAYNDFASGNTLGVAYSSDSGANWNSLQLAMPSSPLAPPIGAPPGWLPGVAMTRMFDPTITADASGNLYAACIADGGQNPSGNPLGGVDSGLYSFKSTDYGVSWSGPTQIAYDFFTTVVPPGNPPGNYEDPNYRFNDRCRIRADAYAGSNYTNNVYVTWIKDRGLQDKNISPRPLGDIYFARSTDGGNTWNAPTSPTPTINQTTHDMGSIPVMDIASNGNIYLAWLDYNVWTSGVGQIYMRQSTDGGATFTDWNGVNQDHPVASINLPPLNLSDASGVTDIIGKANSGTPIAVNPNNPNELYIAYAANPGVPGDEADVFLIKSTNAGQTWSTGAPVRINDDVGVTDQAFPWIDIKPDGTIDVAWYDKRNSLNDDAWDVYIAKSTDSGASFSTNYRVSDVTAASGWFGEYLGLAVDSTDAYVAFAQLSQTDPGDIWFDSVANAKIPEPATLALLAVGLLAVLRSRRR